VRNLVLCAALFPGVLFPQGAHFVEHTLASDLKGGYQVVVADLNHDGKPDLIALASGMTELVWFENPTWERHVIARNLPHMINLAAWDYDGDGIPEIVMAYEFANEASKSIGIVAVLHHNGDPRELWSVKEIDRLTTSHRLRWADPAGDGKKVLVNAPLTGAKAAAPEYRDHVPLVFYRPGEWKRETIDAANEGVQHGIFIVDWDGKGRDAILTASFSGIHLYRYQKDGKWARTEISKGDPAAWPKSGSSDVAVGTLGKERFLAAIEPWHGNQVAVYRLAGKEWNRKVLDDSFLDGHTVIASDLDGNGRDVIIAGMRGGAKSVYLYRAGAGGEWKREALDSGGIPAAACAAADLNGDGRIDVACIGGTVLKWYENQAGH
jgi:hypothetical protein